MKNPEHKTFLLPLLALAMIAMLLSSCEDSCQIKQQYTYLEPVYTTTADIRAAVKLTAPIEINEPGKIYVKDSWLYVNEVGKGIHIVDNTDPSNPIVTNFLAIPGNYDLSIKGDILYADSYIDLIAFDIGDKRNIKVVKRLEGIFAAYSNHGFSVDAQKGVVTSWQPRENVQVTTTPCEATVQPWGGFFFEDGIAMSRASLSAMSLGSTGKSTTGIGGSMARFTIEGDFLYMLDAGNLQVVNIKNTSDPVPGRKDYIAWDIETIFPYRGNLFLGAQSGMHIFSLQDPTSPSRLSLYSHVRSCDPVVVENDLAYVTLRSGTVCQGFTNQLEVLDVKDLKNPVLLKTYPMTNPHGLGIDNKTLFICDGADGLKVFNAEEPLKISDNQLAHYKNINTYDVIPNGGIAIMTGKDGIYQFDYSNPKNVKLISQLSIIRKQ